jgi:hypothetical protein
MPVRGSQPALYYTDGGTPYRYNVDSDRYLQGDFAWTDGSGNRSRLPRGFKPRHVTGISPTTGFRGTAVVPDLGANLWTGAATTFDIEATDGTTDTMNVISLIGEKPSLP